MLEVEYLVQTLIEKIMNTYGYSRNEAIEAIQNNLY